MVALRLHSRILRVVHGSNNRDIISHTHLAMSRKDSAAKPNNDHHPARLHQTTPHGLLHGVLYFDMFFSNLHCF
jgi:hypothetical protein